LVIVNFVAVLISLIHIYIFSLESIFWRKAWVAKIFKMTPEDTKTTSTLAMNQGFYNLFLALEILTGLLLMRLRFFAQGHALITFGVLSVLGAGCVLLITQPKMWRGALIQAGPAAVYFLLRWFSI
jgi:putative membrane protein